MKLFLALLPWTLLADATFCPRNTRPIGRDILGLLEAPHISVPVDPADPNMLNPNASLIQPLRLYMKPSLTANTQTIKACKELLLVELVEDEPPALMVIERRPGWWRIALESGSAWLPHTKDFKFRKMTSLGGYAWYLEKGEATLLAKSIGGPLAIPLMQMPPGDEVYDLDIQEERYWQGRYWLRVSVYSQRARYEEDGKCILGQGWIPMSQVWFYSRD